MTPSEDWDLIIEAKVLKAIVRAIDPYTRQLDEQVHVTERVIENALMPVVKQMTKMQSDADRAAESLKAATERTAAFATEDRERLALRVREDGERLAETSAKRVVEETLTVLGIDTKKPAMFVELIAFVRELRDVTNAGKRQAMFALIGIVMMAIGTGLWAGFKAGMMKP